MTRWEPQSSSIIRGEIGDRLPVKTWSMFWRQHALPHFDRMRLSSRNLLRTRLKKELEG